MILRFADEVNKYYHKMKNYAIVFAKKISPFDYNFTDKSHKIQKNPLQQKRSVIKYIRKNKTME